MGQSCGKQMPKSRTSKMQSSSGISDKGRRASLKMGQESMLFLKDRKSFVKDNWNLTLVTAEGCELKSKWPSDFTFCDIETVYKFSKEIGKGFAGVIRLAHLIWDPKQVYAVKSFLKSDEENKRKVFLAELSFIKEVDHPNIIHFFECYESPTSYDIVMEYCSGGDLVTLVEKNELDERFIKKILHQILVAVNYLHFFGIAHRDLKLDNFLLTSTNLSETSIKLVDFGFAKNFRKAALLSKVGTPYYVAPELLGNVYGKEVDVWAIGVIMFMMFFRSPPFRGKTNTDILNAIKTTEINYSEERFKKISPDALYLLKGLLVKYPSKRLTIPQALLSNFFNEPLLEIRRSSKHLITKEMLMAMTRKKNYSEYQAEILKMMVRAFYNNEGISKLLPLFYYLDKAGNGVVDAAELHEGFLEVELPFTKQQVQRIIDSLYLKAEGVLTYTEFLVCLLDEKFFLKPENLRVIFEKIDTDHSSVITIANLKETFKRQGYAADENFISLFLKDFDLEKNGVISREEFTKAMTNCISK